MSSTLKHRNEIDGLRAVAVLAVLIYHANLSVWGTRILPGGFLGVDVFFVISGFLIGKIVLNQSAKINILSFYERRARRILPALYAVLAASLFAGWFLLLSTQMRSLADGTLSALTFWSNIYFWRHGGYAAEANSLQPLLHTWSLSVEEQFYLLFPLAVLALQILRRSWTMPIFLMIGLGSLGLAEVMNSRTPAAVFYLLPTRAWELLAGVVLAKSELSGFKWSYRPKLWPVLGLIAIVISLFLLDDQSAHPGIATIPTVAGTVAIIAGFGGAGHWLLSTRPMVAIGLISYSAYLWHQPIMAFARITSVNALGAPMMCMMIAASLLIGALSWKYIEQPFRNRQKIGAKAIGLFSVLGCITLAVVSALVIQGNGYPQRFPTIFVASDPSPEWIALAQDGKPCHRNGDLEGCQFKLEGNGARWVLIGDSHAGVFANSLLNNLLDTASSFETLIWGGCPVIFGIKVKKSNHNTIIPCEKANNARRLHLKSLSPSVIVYAARMGAWLEGTRFDNGEGGIEPGSMEILEPVGLYEGDKKEVVAALVTETLEEILAMGHTVVLVYPVPEVGWNVPQTLRKLIPKSSKAAINWLSEVGLTTSKERYLERNRGAFAAYDAVPDNPRLLRVYPDHVFCSNDSGRCKTHDEKNYFYSDDDHLSVFGASLVVKSILRNDVFSHR